MHQSRTLRDIFTKYKVCVINTVARRSIHRHHNVTKAKIMIPYNDEIMNHDYIGSLDVSSQMSQKE